jgi:hypothetical protein
MLLGAGTLYACHHPMEAAVGWTETVDCGADHNRSDVQGALRSRLVNLTLDWEVAAMTLDAQRYKTTTTLERESFRDSANIYRKCISEVTEILTAAPSLDCLQCR